jgi:hypothetical protein
MPCISQGFFQIANLLLIISLGNPKNKNKRKAKMQSLLNAVSILNSIQFDAEWINRNFNFGSYDASNDVALDVFIHSKSESYLVCADSLKGVINVAIDTLDANDWSDAVLGSVMNDIERVVDIYKSYYEEIIFKASLDIDDRIDELKHCKENLDDYLGDAFTLAADYGLEDDVHSQVYALRDHLDKLFSTKLNALKELKSAIKNDFKGLVDDVKESFIRSVHSAKAEILALKLNESQSGKHEKTPNAISGDQMLALVQKITTDTSFAKLCLKLLNEAKQ